MTDFTVFPRESNTAATQVTIVAVRGAYASIQTWTTLTSINF